MDGGNTSVLRESSELRLNEDGDRTTRDGDNLVLGDKDAMPP